MAQAESKVVHGVRVINYKGKQYVEVNERVKQVHAKKVSFEVLDSVFSEIAGRVLCKSTIKVEGLQYVGTAEAKLLNALPKSADETNPFECAETSAVGRALAWAGFGTVDSIASFDEIARGMDRDELNKVLANQQPEANKTPANQSQTAPTNKKETPRQQFTKIENKQPEPLTPAQIRKELQSLELIDPETERMIDFNRLLELSFASEIVSGRFKLASLKKAGDELPIGHCRRMTKMLVELKAKRAQQPEAA